MLRIFRKTPLKLNDFFISSCYKYDPYHCMERGIKEYRIEESYETIGFISIRPSNGQIGIIILNDKYRGRGLGRQMLEIAYNDIVYNEKATTMWAVTSHNHPFWSSIPGISWSDPAHQSVTGCGYNVNLDNKGFIQWLNKKI